MLTHFNIVNNGKCIGDCMRSVSYTHLQLFQNWEERFMKRVLAIVLSAVMALTLLAGCGDNSTPAPAPTLFGLLNPRNKIYPHCDYDSCHTYRYQNQM